MDTLKFRAKRPAREADNGPGSWADLVAWFSELIIRLDRGDLVGAVEAQREIERHGFKVTYRRRPRLTQAGPQRPCAPSA